MEGELLATLLLEQAERTVRERATLEAAGEEVRSPGEEVHARWWSFLVARTKKLIEPLGYYVARQVRKKVAD